MPSSSSLDPRHIRVLFDRIAGSYDLMNDLLSLGIHRHWKSRAIQSLQPLAGNLFLDAATGTGDVAIQIQKRGGRVLGIDISQGMLDQAKQKFGDTDGIQFQLADAASIAQADATFHGAIMAFGLRNTADPSKCLEEMWRVLKPGGTLAILEFGGWTRHRWLGAFIRFAAKLLKRDKGAYEHLIQSSIAFPSAETFAATFQHCLPVDRTWKWRPYTFGICYLYFAKK